MDIIIKAGQLILSLSILVVLHELGHFLPAKLFKMRVEKFYLFFNPYFSLIKLKKGDTEYGIGWLPLGGFVKISGMIDESMDKDQMKRPAEPWEFRAKPAWQRLIVMIGGVVVNLIVGAVCFTLVVYVWGQRKVELSSLENGMYVSEVLKPYGVETGDMVVSIEGKPIKSVDWLNEEVLFFGGRNLEVKKSNGKTQIVKLPEDIDYEIVTGGARGGVFSVPIPVVADSVVAKMPAEKAGLIKGDSIIQVNGKNTTYWPDFVKAITSSEEKVNLLIVRQKDTLGLVMTPDVVEGKKMIGISAKLGYSNWYTVTHEKFSFIQSVPVGVADAMRKLAANVLSFKFVFTKTGAQQMGGMISIGNMFPAQWNWQIFWYMTGMLSLVLAFMNILPIPALDGGHVVFLIYEMIVGKKPHEKVLEYAQVVGMILLFSLMLFANGNDIFKLFK